MQESCIQVPPTDTVHVGLASDDNFVFYGMMAIASAAQRLPVGVKLVAHYLSNGITNKSKQLSERVAECHGFEIRWIDCDSERFKKIRLPEGAWITHASLSRILLPDLVDVDEGKLIYIDCDMIVRRNLCELALMDLKGSVLASCRDAQAKDDTANDKYRCLERFGRSVDIPYFSAGLLVIDIAQWREQRVSEKVFELLQAHGADLPYSDQDALNVVLLEDWQELDSRWNVMTSAFLSPDSLTQKDVQDSWIIHYTYVKPGMAACRHPKRGVFFKVVQQSGWFSAAGFYRWRSKVALGAGKFWARRYACTLRDRLLRRA